MKTIFKVNEAAWDRVARVALGLVLIGLGFTGVIPGTAGTVAGVIGLIPVLTGLLGWCPIYAVLSFGTKKA